MFQRYKILILLICASYSLPSTCNTNLINAIRQSKKNDLLQELKNPNLNINQQDKNGLTPVHWAVIKKNKNLISLLLKHKAKINATDKDGNTPLYLAVLNNFPLITEHLIQNKAAINKKNNNGWTPLHVAAFMGYQEICTLLLKNNAKITSTTNNDQGSLMPIHLAAQKGHISIIKIFFKKDPSQKNVGTGSRLTTLKNKTGNSQASKLTPLHIAIQYNHPKTVQYLLQNKVLVNAVTDNGWTPLHTAAFMGYQKICTLLLKNGAQQFANKSLFTPLDLAYKYDHDKIIKLLTPKKALEPLTKKQAKEKIIDAASNNQLKLIIEIISQYPSLINHQNDSKSTALIEGCKNGHLNIVQFYLDAGADITIQDSSGRSAYNAAALYGNQKCVDAIATSIKKSGGTVPAFTLHESVALGDKNRLQIYLNNNGDLNAKGLCDFTLLHAAANGGQKELATLLIAKKANIEARDKWQYTPLHRAAANNAPNIAILLIKNKANKEAHTVNQQTPFHQAAENNAIEIMEILKTAGANTNSRDEWGLKPLHRAAREGSYNAINWLLKNGAQIEDQSNDKKTPLAWATIKGEIQAAQILLLHKANIECRDKFKCTPLHRAAENKNLSMAQLLIAKGASIKARDKFKCTPLHRAAENGDLRMAKLLLEKKAKINATQMYGKTALESAITNGHLRMVKLLATNGARVNRAALETAINADNERMVKLLIALGANKEQRDSYDLTPLIHAASKGKVNAAAALIDCGAKLNAFASQKGNSTTKYNFNALRFATEKNHRNMIVLLLRRGIEESSPTRSWKGSSTSAKEYARKNGHTEIFHLINNNSYINILKEIDNKNVAQVKSRLNQTVPVNFKNEYGQSLLHCAVNNNDQPMVKLLLDKQAAINILDENNQTPLHYSAKKGNREIAQLLISHGAILNCKDDQELFPLDIARKNSHKNLISLFKSIEFLELINAINKQNVDKIKLLLSQDPMLDASGDDGLTPLHHAIKKNNIEIVELLLNANANCNLQDTQGGSPVFYAIDNGNIPLIRLLIKHNASFEIKNNDNQTPIDRAKELGNKTILNFLQKNLEIDLEISGSSSPSFEFNINEPLKTGMIIDNFVIDHTTITLGKKIGEGGFGAVFLGKWNGQDVAVKKLLSKSLTEKSKEEFKRETKIWSKLRHPNIAQLYGICLPPAPYCMIMPYKKQGSLYSVLQKSKELTWDTKKRLAIDIISALHYLHEKNILHRDLKSLNVLVSQEEGNLRAQLTDFGLSVVKRETTSSSKANANQVAGTLLWMAPELLKGKLCTRQSDIWAYGMILLELATKKLPYSTAHPSIIGRLIEKGTLPDIPTNIPSYFSDLMKKCWKVKSERPTTAQILAYFNITSPTKAAVSKQSTPNTIDESITTPPPLSNLLESNPPAITSSSLMSSSVISTGSGRTRRRPPKRTHMIKPHPLLGEIRTLLDKAYPEELADNDEETLEYRNEILAILKECSTLSRLPETKITELSVIKNEIHQELQDEDPTLTTFLKT